MVALAQHLPAAGEGLLVERAGAGQVPVRGVFLPGC